MALSTTVSELYCFTKCFGTRQFLRGLWMDISAACVAMHMRTDANNLVATASTTRLPEQKKTSHIDQMLRTEYCSGQIDDLAHASSADLLSDCLTTSSAKSDALYKAMPLGILPKLDMHPLFRSLLKHKAYWSIWLHSILGPQAPFVSFFGEIPLSVIC